MISTDEIIGVVPAVLASDCQVSCTAGHLSFKTAQFREHLGVGGRRSFLVWDPISCGSSGCPTAAIAIGEDGVYYLGDGLGLSEQSDSLLPVSNRSRISNGPPAKEVDKSQSGTRPSFAEKYPTVQVQLDQVFSGAPIARDAVSETFDTLVDVVYSDSFGKLVLDRLNVAPNEFLDSFFLDSDVFGSGLNPSFAQNLAEGLVKDAAISIMSNLVADYVVRVHALPDADRDFQNLAIAPLSTLMQESLHVVTAPNGAVAVSSGLMRRFWDIVDIYLATRGLMDTQDQQMIAAVVGTDSVAELVSRDPTERSDRIAKEVFKDLLERAESVYGADDADAVVHILKLTRSALLRQKQGDLEKATLLRRRIIEIGNDTSNIHPFALITNPKDWVDAAFNWGKDGPQRAARIAIEATTLRNLSWSPPEQEYLCSQVGSQLENDEIDRLVEGAWIIGKTDDGKSWSEYLSYASQGRKAVRIISNNKTVTGDYSIDHGGIAFVYGGDVSAERQRVSRCLSDEGSHVLSGDSGQQNLLITRVRKGHGGRFIKKNWGDLAETSLGNDDEIDGQPHKHAVITRDHFDIVRSVIGSLAVGSQYVQIDSDSCTLTVIDKRPIEQQVVSPGSFSWSDWMGDTTDGRRVIGSSTTSYQINIETIDTVTEGTAGNLGRLILNSTKGYVLETKREEYFKNPEKNSLQHRQLRGGISTSIADGVDRFVLFRNVNSLIRICKGEVVRTPVESTNSDTPGANRSSQSLPAASDKEEELPTRELATALATCASIVNTEARLQCFEAVTALAAAQATETSNTVAAVPQEEPRPSFTATDMQRFLQLAGAVHLSENPFYYFENIESCVYKRVERWVHRGRNIETSFVIPLAQIDIAKSQPGEMAIGSNSVQAYEIHASRGLFFDVKDSISTRTKPEAYVSKFVARKDILEFETLLRKAVSSCQL